MIHIYYGFGKGKTSALNGMVVRAHGAAMSVLISRFLKGVKTSEDSIFEQIGISIVSLHPSTKFVYQMNNAEKQQTQLAINEQIQFILSNYKKYKIIVLDEFLDIIYLNFLSEEKAIEFLNKISNNVEIIISGHYKFKGIFKKADLITFFKPEKHYFNKGIVARKGIEF